MTITTTITTTISATRRNTVTRPPTPDPLGEVPPVEVPLPPLLPDVLCAFSSPVANAWTPPAQSPLPNGVRSVLVAIEPVVDLSSGKSFERARPNCLSCVATASTTTSLVESPCCAVATAHACRSAGFVKVFTNTTRRSERVASSYDWMESRTAVCWLEDRTPAESTSCWGPSATGESAHAAEAPPKINIAAAARPSVTRCSRIGSSWNSGW